MPKRIVVVEDDPLIGELVKEILAPLYEVHMATDGDSGLETIRRVVPDLAVIDIKLPRMHGFELCQVVRADERLKGVRILIVSAKSYLSDIKTAAEVGVNGYLVKPFEPKDLREKVREILGAPVG